MKVVTDFKDYTILDMANGEKLEQWSDVTLVRPDPQIIWSEKSTNLWDKADAIYSRSNTGGGAWNIKKSVPNSWTINYQDLKFNLKLMGFKHTGLFPEQATNWDFMMEKIKNSNRPITVLNLFAYTGGATMACASAGAIEVVHVDASKGMTEWAKENQRLSGLEDCKIRFIVDDCLKFVEREARRGRKYDVIIMDPPSYGRGPNGEVWKFEHNIHNLIMSCMKILSDKPLFFLINSYTTGISSTVLYNILKTTMEPKYKGVVDAGEVGLSITKNNMVLPCGIYGRWQDE